MRPTHGHPSAIANDYERLAMRVTACRYLANLESLKALADCSKAEENLFDGYCLLFTRQGVLHLRMGEWLVRKADGEFDVVTDAEFGREFEAV